MNFDKAVEQALLNPKYNSFFNDRDNFIEKILKSIQEFLWDLISKILNIETPDFDLSLFSYNNNVLFAFAVIAAAIICVAAIIVIVYAVRRRKRKRNAFGMEEIFNMLDNKKILTVDLIEQSDKYALAGDFRNAVRYRYICLLWITNQRIMKVSPSKVNSRILSDIGRFFPALYGGFKDIVDVFNYTWFGNKEIDKAAYDGFSGKFNYVLKEAHAYEKTAG